MTGSVVKIQNFEVEMALTPCFTIYIYGMLILSELLIQVTSVHYFQYVKHSGRHFVLLLYNTSNPKKVKIN